MKIPILLIITGIFLINFVSADFTLMDATTGGNCSQATVIRDTVDGTDGSNYCEFIHDYDASGETEGEFKWQNYNPANISAYANLTWTINFNETPTGNPLLRFYCNGFSNRMDYTMTSPTSGNNSYNINMSDDFTTVGTCDLGSIVDIILYAQNGYLPDDTTVRIYSITAVNATLSDFTAPTVSLDINLSNNVSNWFNWTYGGNATNFTVWYNSSGTWIALLNTTDLLTTSYNHTSLTNDSTYQYQLNVTWNTTEMGSTGIFSLSTDSNDQSNNPPNTPTLNSPADDSSNSEDDFRVTFSYTITDDDLDTLTCSLQIDSVVNATNSSISSGSTITNFVILPSATTTHDWFVNCSDGQDSSTSATWQISTSDDTPDQVVGLTYSANDTVISLSWEQQNDADIEFYYIYRGGNAGGPYSLLNYTVNANHDDAGLTAGQTFYYVVSSKDTGDKYGVNSSVLQASTTGASGGVSGPGGGGGGETPILETEVIVEVERLVCGDLICSDSTPEHPNGENPGNCFSDCPVNVDNIVTCVFNEEIACLYEDAWFTQFLIFVLIVGAIYLGISGDN